MSFIAIESVPRLALKSNEAATALGSEQLLRDLVEHGGLRPVKRTRKETTYSAAAIERALNLVEASGVLVEQPSPRSGTFHVVATPGCAPIEITDEGSGKTIKPGKGGKQ